MPGSMPGRCIAAHKNELNELDSLSLDFGRCSSLGSQILEKEPMALLNWNLAKYSVGVANLDHQHAAFIRSLNRLHATMLRGKGRDITGSLLLELTANWHDHFSAEEKLMTSTGYRGLAHHRAEHQCLNAKLVELKALHDRGEVSASIPLLNLMRDWISTHLLEEDQRYAPWLHEHGVR